MRIWYRAGLLAILSGWCFAAFAQAAALPAFGAGMSQISWDAWKWVLIFCFLGCNVRLMMDLKNSRLRPGAKDRTVDLVAIYTVGFGAGFLAFVAAEGVNGWFWRSYQVRVIPDLGVCGIIFAAAINKEFILDSVLRGGKALRDKGIRMVGGTPPTPTEEKGEQP